MTSLDQLPPWPVELDFWATDDYGRVYVKDEADALILALRSRLELACDALTSEQFRYAPYHKASEALGAVIAACREPKP